PERCIMVVNGAVDRRGGVDGAVRLLPWFLMNARRWTDRVAATAGLHLAEPFGTWRHALPQAGAEGGDVSMGPGASRQPGSNPHNGSVRQAAHARREAYPPAARAINADILARTGRPPGRDQLRAAMARSGQNIGERMARDLVERLRAESAAGRPEVGDG